MPWVRLDDHIDQHPKIAALDDHALALFVCGLAYCNRNLTDGFIPDQVGLGQLRFCEGNTVPAIRQLEAEGLWEEVDGGWRVHDYHDFQPKRTTVLRERRETAKRVTAYRHRNASSNADSNAVTTPPTRTRTRTRTRSPVPDPAPSGAVQVDPPEKTQAAPPSETIRRESTTFFVPENLLSRWQALYPSLNVRQEIQRAFERDAAAPPSERKKKLQRYLAAWLAREGRWNGHRRPKPTERTLKERAAEIEANLRAGEDQHDQ